MAPLLSLDAKIVIVGCGISGIGAALKLIKHGFRNVRIVEATGRSGGRIKTGRLGKFFFFNNDRVLSKRKLTLWWLIRGCSESLGEYNNYLLCILVSGRLHLLSPICDAMRRHDFKHSSSDEIDSQ